MSTNEPPEGPVFSTDRDLGNAFPGTLVAAGLNELAAVVRHRVALLVVVGKVPLPLLAEAFVASLPIIRAFVAEHERPFIASVYRGQQLPDGTYQPGRVELAYPK